jgi:hypothetical protein
VLLGAQRCEQLLRCVPRDVNFLEDWLRLYDFKGAHRREAPRLHKVALCAAAKRELSELLATRVNLQAARPLFDKTKTGKTFNTNAVFKEVRAISDRLLARRHIREPFSYSDLRRTVETQMTSLKVAQEVRAHIQSHDLSGVQVRHYNRHDFHDEMKAALEVWSQHVLACAAQASRLPMHPSYDMPQAVLPAPLEKLSGRKA